MPVRCSTSPAVKSCVAVLAVVVCGAASAVIGKDPLWLKYEKEWDGLYKL